ncbi:MAG: penicillin-binding protein activator LpoB [bacterium]|nr:penicillin-binding protein activator LpoB [bacterium]MDD5756694.1 penicillin-binding protein activator LpoB [bacterium]
MKKYMVGIVFFMLALSLLAGCGGTKVERVDSGEMIDLSGNWNDTDSQLVSAEMINDSLSRPWVSEFRSTQGKPPTVIVGTVRNRSSEHINTETFVKDLERELLNSGKVKFVVAREPRTEVREEKMDQADFADPATIKAMGKEKGADFMLQGQINTIMDAAGKQAVMYYQVELEMINILTNEKVWIGQKKIKKLVTRPKVKP